MTEMKARPCVPICVSRAEASVFDCLHSPEKAIDGAGMCNVSMKSSTINNDHRNNCQSLLPCNNDTAMDVIIRFSK